MKSSNTPPPPQRTSAAPARPAPVAPSSSAPKQAPARAPNPADQRGRVTHDARGNAVWRWAVNLGSQALESTSRLLKRLEVPELAVEEKPKDLELEERGPGGGYDPYNQRKSVR